jgi:hypothetical protein
MGVSDSLLPNPALNTAARAAALQSQVLMLTKLESLFACLQEES